MYDPHINEHLLKIKVDVWNYNFFDKFKYIDFSVNTLFVILHDIYNKNNKKLNFTKIY